MIKSEKKLQKLCLTYYNLLIVQGLWEAYYQILLITFLMDLTKLDLNTDTMIKNVKLVELNINVATFFLCNKTLKMIS